MAFDNPTRNRLQRLVGECRDLLTKEFDSKLQEIYGIYAAEGRVLDLEKLPHLDDQRLRVATLLRERINYLAASGGRTETAVTNAVRRVLREQAFTVLNRFVALRMAEERGIIVESVGNGFNSKAFKTFSEIAFSGLGDSYQRYRVFLFCLFDEMSTDLGVLFDRASPYGLLFPRQEVLLQLFNLLSAPEIKSLWKEDETVGWIYQYFNDPSERKKMRDESAAPRNSRELAVRNQFFTPRYVVEFLTDNTLGRIWHEMTQGETKLKEQCRYLVRRPNEIFLKPGETTPEPPKQDNLSQEDLLEQPIFIPHRPIKDPRTILMLDPACGSMHFGLYAFDLFEVIYGEAWALEEKLGADALSRPPGMKSLHATYASKDALLKDVPRLIIEHNLHGIDIDPRCAQIAGLSLWLRAQKAWQRLGLKPAERPAIRRSNIVCAEPMPGEKELLREFVEREFPAAERAVCLRLLEAIFDKMQLAGEAGSLLKIEEEIRSAIEDARDAWQKLATKPAELFTTTELNQISTAPELTGLEQAVSSLTTAPRHLTTNFWERIEERIYAALRDYAEQAENGGGFQRRLFAEDAARGFAFIDVCRKRYDVALMNPPFGEFSLMFKALAEKAFVAGSLEIISAFVERGFQLCNDTALLGAISSRTPFYQTTTSRWRTDVVTPSNVSLFVELGGGVLDSAMVETVMYVLGGGGTGAPSIFSVSSADKFPSNGVNIESGAEGLFVIDPKRFQVIPGSPFAYWLSPIMFHCLEHLPKLEDVNIKVRVGLQSGDDFRFMRLWWEVPGSAKGWVAHAKGGENSPYFTDIHLVVNWERNGYEVSAHPSAVTRSSQFYLQPGLTFAYRTFRFSPAILPRNCITGVAGMGVFSDDFDLSFLSAVLNSSLVNDFISARLNRREMESLYQAGVVSPTPFARFSAAAKTELAALGHQQNRLARVRFLVDEASRIFCSNNTFSKSSTLSKAAERTVEDWRNAREELLQRFDRIDQLTRESYGFDTATAHSCNNAGRELLAVRCFTTSEHGSKSFVEIALGFFVGVAFGRWDIRYATAEQAAPELADPFAPLPVCPPGQLQNAQGLPARPEDVPAAYPVRIPWDGILVDDPNHPLDLERRVREVIEIIWSGQEGNPTAEAIEHEACEILGVKSLRDYFRKPAGFFADHLKRYSKSRRQAPIYWPLSTASGSYTLWIYYHRLTDQTLFQCVNDFLKPKITEVEGDLTRMQKAESREQRAELERLTALRAELVEFRDELLRVAQLPYKPNLNDGVLITASPLWKLFRLPKWQKDLKACWESLSKGEYDWAHLALSIWPQRVKDACKKDRSIAIAHGLEELCEVKAPEKKAKKGKKKQEAELAMNEE